VENKVTCPLCLGDNLRCSEKIKAKNIVDMWLKQNLDASNLFGTNNILEKNICLNCGLKFFSPFISGDNAFYSELGKEEWYYLHEDKTEFNYCNNYIKDGDNILDIGSGRGAFTKYIDKNISYTGLELSSKAVEYAKEENINVIKRTIQDYALSRENTHDVVVAFQVLEHITNVNSFIESSIKVIKPDGLFIIAVPNNDSFIKNAQNNLLNLPPHHLLHWNEESLRYIANKFNLMIIDVYKEKLTNIHKNWYYSVVISKFFRNIFCLKTKSINIGFTSKLINKVSAVLLKIINLFTVHVNKDGHTVIIVFKKINV
jgi:2-polyprenyl-3-methyl-5-hydroxy-6-metoxy-1,4-benzoquinol methylase